jgi:hypothetical protein
MDVVKPVRMFLEKGYRELQVVKVLPWEGQWQDNTMHELGVLGTYIEKGNSKRGRRACQSTLRRAIAGESKIVTRMFLVVLFS